MRQRPQSWRALRPVRYNRRSMTSRHYAAIAGLIVGIAGLGIAVTQPFQSSSIQWAAFTIGTIGFILGMVIASTLPSEPVQ